MSTRQRFPEQIYLRCLGPGFAFRKATTNTSFPHIVAFHRLTRQQQIGSGLSTLPLLISEQSNSFPQQDYLLIII